MNGGEIGAAMLGGDAPYNKRAWCPFCGAFQNRVYFFGFSTVNDNNTYQGLC